MKQAFSVSVIIPAYNAEAFLGRAVDSVLAQTRRPDELIVVDDGSTDGTRGLVQQYGERITYIHQEKGGAAQARNTGIAAAGSEWIAFLDADDRYPADKLERQIELLAGNPDLVWCYGNYTVCPFETRPHRLSHDPVRAAALLSGKAYFEDYLHAFSAGFPSHTNTLLIRRDILYEIGLFDPSLPWGQDIDLSFRVAYWYPKVGYLPESLAFYHFKQPGSITDTHWQNVSLRSDFIKRHLALSRDSNRQEAFAPCCRRLLERWIRQLFAGDSCKELWEMVCLFSTFVPFRLRIETWIRCKGPRFLVRWIERYFQIKNRCRKPAGGPPEISV